MCRKSACTEEERRGEEEMLHLMRKFWRDESGQDLIEYTLLLAFVSLASASLFLGTGSSLSGMWKTSSSELVVANTAAS
jgi:Flp pilus assembly pilin Flp